jgi:chaperonin GroES
MRELPVIELKLSAPEDFGNVAEKLDVNERRTLATDLIALVKVDETSMNEWLGKARGYLDQIKNKDADASPQNREQEGANEQPPPSTEMMLSAAIQFSARATDALLGEPDLAKASEPGAEPLAGWVSSQLRSKDPNWAMDTDPLIFHMSITGLSWRKRDFDMEDKTFHSNFLNCEEVIINANVRGNGERAPRITHQFERYPYEIERSIERGKWIDYEPIYDTDDPQAPKKFYEVDAWLDFDGDEIDEPWTVVISIDDIAEVVRIRPRWSRKTMTETKDELYFNPIRRFFPYRMLPNPDGGFFPMGFGELLDRVQSSADNLLGSITETAKSEAKNAGVMAGGGFGLPSQVELKNDTVTAINTDGAPLQNRFQAFPLKQVSPGSVQVFEKLVAMGNSLAGSVNVLEGIPASTTATVAKGIIDSNQQVQSAVHRRLVMSMTLEFRDFVAMADAYDQLPEGMMGAQGDMIAVTADPQLATEMQRTAMAGIYKELLDAPMVFNPAKVGMRLLNVLRIPNAEELIAAPQTPQATPFEKIKGYIDMEKAKTDRMKVTAGSAVQLTQALLNMVTAAGGMQNNRAALLTMAQLEQTVKQLMDQSNDAGSGDNGLAQSPGNGGTSGAPSPAPGGAGDVVPAGAAGGPGGAGESGGAV